MKNKGGGGRGGLKERASWSEGIIQCIICWLPWKQGLPVVTVFLAKNKDLGTQNYVLTQIFSQS